jgi:hypothetical protein
VDVTDQFDLWLAAWLAGFAVVLWSQRQGLSGAGLVVAYALQLWVIHWLAPAIYALPWYTRPDELLVAGLRESTIAIIGFAIGCGVLVPIILRRNPDPGVEERTREDDSGDRWLRRTYLGIGVVAYFLAPVLQPVPTIGALASVASNLLLVAFAMECWNALRTSRGATIWRWIGLAALLPFVTIVTQGFLSYGFAAMLTIFAFVATVYRPRWKVIACSVVVSFLALSMYVTYMRDRTEIRAVVWGQEAYSVRFTQVLNTFRNFEFLDIRNTDHLRRIDDRLNQTSLVGAAVLYLRTRPAEFARGETIRDALLSPIPRALWRDKPMAAGSGDLVSRFTGIRFGEGTSVGIGHVLEWYVNFGSAGVFFGSLFMGILLGWIDLNAVSLLARGDWPSFSLWYLPALSLLQVGGSMMEAVSGACAALLITLAIHRLRPASIRHAAAIRRREAA